MKALPAVLGVLVATAATPIFAADVPVLPMTCAGAFSALGTLDIVSLPDGTMLVTSSMWPTRHVSADGTILGTWPDYGLLYGVGLGEFVYATNQTLGSVGQYDIGGNSYASFGDGVLVKPMDVAVIRGSATGSAEHVAVLDRQGGAGSRVYVYSSGVRLYDFAVTQNAYGLDADASGNLYVTDSFRRVTKYDSYGHPLASWEPALDDSARFTGIAVSPNGRVHVVDFGDGHVYTLSSSLELLGEWDLTCLWPGQCSAPPANGHHLRINSVAVDANGYAVVGSECGTVTRFEPNENTPVRIVTWGRLKSFYR